MIIAYASRTGTRRNLAGLRGLGWRLMVSARGVLQHEGFRYALDNGAWTAFLEWKAGKRRTADPCLRSFLRAVRVLGAGADFIVVPDIVEGGARAWAMTRYWLRRLRRDRRLRGAKLLIAVQDGYEFDAIAPYLSERVGVFVGGSTDWKLATMAGWAALARSKGAICHVGRVNTVRRIHLCEHAGATSFDGSGASRFAKILQRLENGRRQRSFMGAMSVDVPAAA